MVGWVHILEELPELAVYAGARRCRYRINRSGSQGGNNFTPGQLNSGHADTVEHASGGSVVGPDFNPLKICNG